MPRYFLDTSALVKNYHNEVGTPEVQRILADVDSEFLISSLAAVEILSAFAGKVRKGSVSTAGYRALRGRFLADIAEGRFSPIKVLDAHYQAAADLIGEHGMRRQLCTLDAIQLAVAIDMHRSLPLDHFVCSDQRLCDVAALEGFAVIRP